MAEGGEHAETASDFVESLRTVSLGSSDWRDTETANQCLDHLCLSKRLSDVNLRFNKEPSVKLPAHKFVLSMRSRVFEAIFYGNHGLAKNEITIDDVGSETMRILVRFMYTDKADINWENVFKCLHAAKLYAVAGLTAVCSSFLEKNINAGNVCTIHEQDICYSMKELQTKCFDFMVDYASDVFKSEGFLNISKTTLAGLLKSDDLDADEECIFSAASVWAEAQCLSRKITVTPDNKRICLGEALHEIRFPTMSITNFAKKVTPTGILTSDEQIMLYQYLASNRGPLPLSKFISRKRGGNVVTIDREMYKNQQEHQATRGYVLKIALAKAHMQYKQRRGDPVILKTVTGTFAVKVNGVIDSDGEVHDFTLKGDKIIFHPALQIFGEIQLQFVTNENKKSSTFLKNFLERFAELSCNVYCSTKVNGKTVNITMVPNGLSSLSFEK